MAFKDQVLVLWGEAYTKWYETELQNKTLHEVENFLATKVSCYLAICAWGIGSMLFENGASSMEMLKKAHPLIAYACTLFFLLSFLCITLGAAAAFFPRSTPLQPVDLTGFGAWITVVRTIAYYHLHTYGFHPKPQAAWAIASFAITSAVVSAYWACTLQDPRFLHVIVKLLGWLFRWIWCKVLAIWSVAVGWMKNTWLSASVRAWEGCQPLPGHP